MNYKNLILFYFSMTACFATTVKYILQYETTFFTHLEFKTQKHVEFVVSKFIYFSIMMFLIYKATRIASAYS